MKKIKSIALKIVKNVNGFWTKNKRSILNFVMKYIKVICNLMKKFIVKFIKISMILAVIGVVINVLVERGLLAKFPENWPVVYQWFNGWETLVKFGIKTIVNGVYSIFTGEWRKFHLENKKEIIQLINQFINWINAI